MAIEGHLGPTPESTRRFIPRPPEKNQFTTAELMRLKVYRNAIRAGFFTDWDGSSRRLTPMSFQNLSATATTSSAEGFPFNKS